jgi:hypothetical protein
VNAPFVARATDLQCSSISSINTSLVSSMPMATMARLSPTNIMSMPAWSATWALGKSCAVIMVMGSFLRYRLCSVLIVTGFRTLTGEEPRGECELHRYCVTGTEGRMRGIDVEGRRDFICVGRDEVRKMFTKTRDMVGVSVLRY